MQLILISLIVLIAAIYLGIIFLRSFKKENIENPKCFGCSGGCGDKGDQDVDIVSTDSSK